jgi:hypothetical protein
MFPRNVGMYVTIQKASQARKSHVMMKVPNFLEPEGTLSCSQKPAIGLDPEPNYAGPHPPSLSL